VPATPKSGGDDIKAKTTAGNTPIVKPSPFAKKQVISEGLMAKVCVNPNPTSFFGTGGDAVLP
jgi:hypothetical protein